MCKKYYIYIYLPKIQVRQYFCWLWKHWFYPIPATQLAADVQVICFRWRMRLFMGMLWGKLQYWLQWKTILVYMIIAYEYKMIRQCHEGAENHPHQKYGCFPKWHPKTRVYNSSNKSSSPHCFRFLGERERNMITWLVR